MKPQLLTLHSGLSRLDLAPETGGSIAAYRTEATEGSIDWLRPASDQALAERDPLGMACFPLVPFSNRIRHGRFQFEGVEVALPPNFGDHPHAIHGHGWQAPWTVANTDQQSATLTYRHEPDAWPWAYEAAQQFRLEASALEVELTITNLSDDWMPAGLGLHPYFPRTPEATVSAEIKGMWETDAEVMPTRWVPAWQSEEQKRAHVVNEVTLDNVFTGWNGRAEVVWPEQRLRLVIEANPVLEFLVLYTPPGETFFCVEPVSHETDAFNRASTGAIDTGMRILAPGHKMTAKVAFRVGRVK